MRRPPRPLVLSGAALVLVASIGACTGQADDDVRPAPTSTPTSSTTTAAAPAPFDAGPAQWRPADSELARPRVLGVSGTSVLVHGLAAGVPTLAAYGREDGVEAWRRAGTAAARIGAGARGPVVVPSRRGAVALDQRTGRQRWRWTGPGPVRVVSPAEAGVTVLATADRAVALDARTGRVRWRAPGVVNDVGHGLVLVRRADVPTLLDVRTGSETWRGEAGQVVKGLLDDAVLVADVDDGGGDLVDLAGADEPTRVDTLVGRLPLTGDLLAWYAGDEQHTLAAGEDAPTTGAAPQTPDGRPLDLLTVVGAGGGYVFHQLDAVLYAVGRDGQVAGRVDVGADAAVTVGDGYLLIDSGTTTRPEQRVLPY